MRRLSRTSEREGNCWDSLGHKDLRGSCPLGVPRWEGCFVAGEYFEIRKSDNGQYYWRLKGGTTSESAGRGKRT